MGKIRDSAVTVEKLDKVEWGRGGRGRSGLHWLWWFTLPQPKTLLCWPGDRCRDDAQSFVQFEMIGLRASGSLGGISADRLLLHSG